MTGGGARPSVAAGERPDTPRTWRGSLVVVTARQVPWCLRTAAGTPVSAEVRAGPLFPVCRPSQSAWDAAECPAGSRDGRLLKDFAAPTGPPREVMEPPGKRSGPASQSRAIGVAAWRTGGRPGEVPGTVASSRQWGQGRPSVTRQGCLRQAEPAFLTGALCPP